MKKSVKIGLLSVAGIIAVVSSLALFTHARESSEDSQQINGVHENESAVQALSENFNHQNSGSNSTQGPNSESQQSESSEAPGQ